MTEPMKTFEQLQEDWGNAKDGKSIEEYIFDYMSDELFVERQLIKVKQKEKECAVAAERERIKKAILELPVSRVGFSDWEYLVKEDILKLIDSL